MKTGNLKERKKSVKGCSQVTKQVSIALEVRLRALVKERKGSKEDRRGK